MTSKRSIQWYQKENPTKTFTREFKLETLRQLEASTRPATELAIELGIRPNQLYKWREQLITKKDKAFSGSNTRAMAVIK